MLSRAALANFDAGGIHLPPAGYKRGGGEGRLAEVVPAIRVGCDTASEVTVGRRRERGDVSGKDLSVNVLFECVFEALFSSVCIIYRGF